MFCTLVTLSMCCMFNIVGVPVAQWVKCLPTELARVSSSTHQEEPFNITSYCPDLIEILLHRHLAALKPLQAGKSSNKKYHQEFLLIYCSINAFKGTFFTSTDHLWNGLLANVISATTLENFKLLVGACILRP